MAVLNILTIGYINVRAQTGLPIAKRLKIEAFPKHNNCDIVHLQEANIEEDTFTTCNFIKSSYNIIENNSTNKYGTASLVKTDLQTENIRCDCEGRMIVFDIGMMTFGNIYLHSGTDAPGLGLGEKNTAVKSFPGCSSTAKILDVLEETSIVL